MPLKFYLIILISWWLYLDLASSYTFFYNSQPADGDLFSFLKVPPIQSEGGGEGRVIESVAFTLRTVEPSGAICVLVVEGESESSFAVVEMSSGDVYLTTATAGSTSVYRY